MAHDRDNLAKGVGILIAGGVTAVGFLTGQAPLQTLADTAAATAAGIGGNWIASLGQRAYEHWSEGWFTERGALHQEILLALSRAFEDAVRRLQDDWWSDPDYLELRRKNREEADITLEPLRWLREDAEKLFQQPKRLSEALQHAEVSALLHQNEDSARHFLDEKLRNYFFGHNARLVEFVQKRLADEWVTCFERRLNDPSDEGTRAWRAFQRLWQASLEAAMAQIVQQTADARDAMLWLREWAQRLETLPSTHRDPTGQDAFDAAMRPVHTRLDEIKAAMDRLEAGQERIEESLAEIRQAQSWICPFQPVGGQLLLFVSSMIGELQEERGRLEQALRQGPFMPWVFEHTTAASSPLPEAYLRRVRECHLFVLLVAANISQPVIDEYETALDARKPLLAFIKRGDRSDEAASFVQRMEQAGAFKYALFESADDLARMVVVAVLQELIDSYHGYWQAVKAGYIPILDVDEVIRAYATEIITHDLFAD